MTGGGGGCGLGGGRCRVESKTLHYFRAQHCNTSSTTKGFHQMFLTLILPLGPSLIKSVSIKLMTWVLALASRCMKETRLRVVLPKHIISPEQFHLHIVVCRPVDRKKPRGSFEMRDLIVIFHEPWIKPHTKDNCHLFVIKAAFEKFIHYFVSVTLSYLKIMDLFIHNPVNQTTPSSVL